MNRSLVKYLFAFLFFIQITLFGFSQKRDYQWYFDFSKAMHFNAGPPTQIAGAQLTAIECSSAMADSVTGSLLFFMQNDTVFDNTNTQMPNGKGINSAATPTQMLTLPMPGNKDLYYIINHSDPMGWGPPAGVSYSVVDMTLNGGKGDIIAAQKNILVVNPGAGNQTSEGITAIKHANGYDWWVLSHGLYGGTDRIYYKFLITNAGVQPVTTQVIGTAATNNTGYLVASPDGKKVCRVDIQGHINLFDFDRCTGVLSNFVDLSETFVQATGAGSFYGCAFSPDSKVLYVTGNYKKELLQFDITAANIPLSKIIVWTAPPAGFLIGFGGMQLAPDGKIYFCNTNTKLCAVNNPNTLGVGCNPATVAALTWPMVNYIPYFPNYNLGPTTTAALASNDTTICSGGSVQIGVTTATTYTWVPATGLSCVNCQNPIASPTSTTTYTVNVSGGCGNSSDSIKVTVVNSLTVNAGSNISICSGSSVSLNGSGTGSFSWSPSTGLSASNISNPIANPTASITYTLTVSSGSCAPATDTVNISVTQGPTANAGVNQTICVGTTVTLNGSGGGAYTWIPTVGISNTSISNPTAAPSITSTYSVIVQGTGVCPADTDAVTITVNQNAVAQAGASNTGPGNSICPGDMVSLNSSGGGSYTWIPSTGLSNSTISNPSVSPTTTTTYSVIVQLGNCLSDTDAVTIVVNPLPVANAGTSVSINYGASTVLTATGSGTYFWSPSIGLSNTTSSNPTASPTITTTYCVLVTDVNGCTDSSCVTVYVSEPLPPIPCGEFYLPNAFSPNNDLENDEFKAYIAPDCVKEFKLIIYNRWGVKVFVTEDVTQGWNGEFKGTMSNSGVYAYYCKSVLVNGKEIFMQGNVSLVR